MLERLVGSSRLPDRCPKDLCDIYLTYQRRRSIFAAMSPLSAAKRKVLLATGTLNPHPEQVQAESFREGDFFDAHDRAQVKYEISPAARAGRVTIIGAANAAAAPVRTVRRSSFIFCSLAGGRRRGSA